MLPGFFNPRSRSLVRGCILVLLSLTASLFISGFPNSHPTPLIIFPALVAIAGTIDTLRCMQPRWSFYHGGVLLLVYMDLMALCMIFFLLFYPYALWIASSH